MPDKPCSIFHVIFKKGVLFKFTFISLPRPEACPSASAFKQPLLSIFKLLSELFLVFNLNKSESFDVTHVPSWSIKIL